MPVLAGVAEREGFAGADWADPDLGRFWPRGVREDGRAEVAPAAPSPDLTVWVDCAGAPPSVPGVVRWASGVLPCPPRRPRPPRRRRRP
ncbi:hypothetical protein [Dietzia sp. UCD-THP]|uniref:hypothetical protein n=1 Tax=Dietzia sp. UCD-THP TaxID=1292020 RepID=UPI0003A463FE|nr:hypothetical protein [Dietzia sp. UCD-THP]